MRPGHPFRKWGGRVRVDLTDGPQSVISTAQERADRRAASPEAYGLRPHQLAALEAEAERYGLALNPDTGTWVEMPAPGTSPPSPRKEAGEMWKLRRWWRRKRNRCELCTAKLVKNQWSRLCQECRHGRGVGNAQQPDPSDIAPNGRP